jgi:hypothetical protein
MTQIANNDGTFAWGWVCSGEVNSQGLGGAAVICETQSGGATTTPPPSTPSLCGSANGATTNATPPANALCATGATASLVTGDGSSVPWAWTCTQGTTSSCEAYPPGYGISCDIGTPYQGQIPAGAQAAGYTTCASNFDFSLSFYATQSNYLTCYGNGSPPYNTIWYQEYPFSPGVPCDIEQVNDPVAGGNVLDLPWKLSYPHNSNAQWMQTISPDNLHVTSYPVGAYYEARLRVSANVYAATTTFWASGGYYDGESVGTEYDFGELDPALNGPGTTPGWDNNIHNWPQGPHVCCGNTIGGTVPSGFDITQYHTYGMRVTTDGSSAIEACGYVDNVFQGCSAFPGAITSANFFRNFLILSDGPNYADNSTQETADNYDTYFQILWGDRCGSVKVPLCQT